MEWQNPNTKTPACDCYPEWVTILCATILFAFVVFCFVVPEEPKGHIDIQIVQPTPCVTIQHQL